jgi:hypothetical protein
MYYAPDIDSFVVTLLTVRCGVAHSSSLQNGAAR